MAKIRPLEVHKKKPIKRNKKGLFQKVVDYLKSDSYMFAPLISSPPSDFSATGVEIKEPIGENKKIKVKQIWKYLKSDSYTYSSLVVPFSSDVLGSKIISSPPTGPLSHLKRVSTEISNREVAEGRHQSIQIGNVSQQIQGQHEMAKHVVLQRCRFSTSMPGKGVLEFEQRKFSVE